MTTSENTASQEPLRILLIGCGPHGRRFYIPSFLRFRERFGLQLCGIAELESKEADTRSYCSRMGVCPDVLPVRQFSGTELPGDVRDALTRFSRKKKIDAVVIATDPMHHVAYASWALEAGYHLLLDKPVSTRRDAVTDEEQAAAIFSDYSLLAETYRRAQDDHGTVCVLCVHRRYHPGILFLRELITDVGEQTGCPVTNFRSYHSDGQWRFPDEMITQKHHSYNEGHGKISHSGFHFFDCVSAFWRAGAEASGKHADTLDVSSDLIFPESHLLQLTDADYLRLFGNEYRKKKGVLDKAAFNSTDFGEIDASIHLNFLKKEVPIAMGSITLLHNGFSRRSWVTPGADLYKGNGRVKHEEHRIHVGPFLSVTALSWQAKDKHERNTEEDALPGGNNHFDIHVFRNADIIGGEPYKMVSLDSIGSGGFDPSRLYIEQVKEQSVVEFFSVLRGEMSRDDLRSDLLSHEFAVSMMSASYRSHIRKQRGDYRPVNIPVVLSDGDDGEEEDEKQTK